MIDKPWYNNFERPHIEPVDEVIDACPDSIAGIRVLVTAPSSLEWGPNEPSPSPQSVVAGPPRHGPAAFDEGGTEQRTMQDELQQYREELEELVRQRTAELEQTHEQLRLTERLASVSTLAAGLGHDMNNILLPARCSLDVLESLDLPPESHEPLRSLRWSLNYLRQLTDGLRLFALDPENPNASGPSTDVKSWWAQTGPLLIRSAKYASFTPSFAENLPRVAIAPHRMTQAVLNLLVNASEAIPEKGGQIRLRIQRIDDGRFVRLSVMDNGRGMPPEVKRRALDPFYTTKTRGLGTGLGLALVRGVVQSVGGTMKIHSTEGRGTSVVLILPAFTEQSNASPQRASQAAEQKPELTTEAIISLDDARAASFLSSLLRAAGWTVHKENADHPPESGLWIVEPHESRRDVLKQFAESHPGKLILFGAPPASFGTFDARVIAQPGNFEEIRTVIGEAMSQFTEGSRND